MGVRAEYLEPIGADLQLQSLSHVICHETALLCLIQLETHYITSVWTKTVGKQALCDHYV